MLGAVLLGLVLAVRGCGGQGEQAAPAAAANRAPERRELPRGGRRIFPDHRVVAFYGSPADEQLGVLGIGSPASAARRLERVARGYARPRRPALPAFELISTVAAAAPGDDGRHRLHVAPAVIDRYLRAARRARALLVLDVQPGRGDFLSEARRLERWLRQPDVGLALDPEWHVGPGEVPGQVIGSVNAAEVNAVSAYLAGLVNRHDLPEKLLVVHQFTEDMVSDRSALRRRPGIALTMNADGFGDRADKVAKYTQLRRLTPALPRGFKLFYEEDENLMAPDNVLSLRPPPDLVVYE